MFNVKSLGHWTSMHRFLLGLAVLALAGVAYISFVPSSLVSAPVPASAVPIAFAAIAFFVLPRARPFVIAGLWGLALITLSHWPGLYDQQANVDLARHLLDRGTYEVGELHRRATYPPAYPLLLAGWSAIFGFDRWAGIVLNVLLDIGAALTLGLLVSERWSKRAGLFAAALYMAWPDRILFSLTASKEGLALLFACQAMLALSRLDLAFSRKESIRLGASSALLALTQPAWVLFPAIAAFIMVGLNWRVMAWAMVPFLALLAPWWVRNYLVLGHFVPLTTAPAMSFYIAATGDWEGLKALVKLGDEINVGPIIWKHGWAAVQADPMHFIVYRARMISRALLFNLGGSVALSSEGWRVSQWLPACQLFYAAVCFYAAQGARIARSPFVLAALLMVAATAVFTEFDLRHAGILVPAIMVGAARKFTIGSAVSKEATR